MKIKSFNDSHLHFVGIGANEVEYFDFSLLISFQDIRDLLDIVRRDIIIGRGWHEENFKCENNPFTKEVIEDERPVVAIRACGHVLVCNDAMMELAGINENTSQVDGGTFDFSTGVFTENALELIYKHIPKPDKNRIKEYMIAANDILLSNGVTSCGSDDFSTLPVDYEVIIEAYKELYEEDKIQVRILEQVNIPDYDKLKEFIDRGYHELEFGNFKMGPLKLLADGSLGGRTALLREPYTDDKENYGVKVFTQDELDKLIHLADRNNMDVAIHAIGDGCIDKVIDSIYKSMSKTNRTHHRHSVIHSQLANKAQIKRMRDLNIAAQTQPIFLNSDIPIIESRLGERSKETYLFNTMYKEGVITTISTDCPVEPLNPFYNLYCATTRKSIKNPELPPFLIDEAFTIEDALKCYTEVPYYLSYDEHKNFNDYVIIDKDIYNCSKEELKDIKVLETYIDGKLVYKRDE